MKLWLRRKTSPAEAGNMPSGATYGANRISEDGPTGCYMPVSSGASARAANTLHGYRSDWAEFTGWCGQHGRAALPATVSDYPDYARRVGRQGRHDEPTAVGDLVRAPAAEPAGATVRAMTAADPDHDPVRSGPTRLAPN